jgi:hypothetical protein
MTKGMWRRNSFGLCGAYTTHEFRHHPSIAPIINYHLYTHRVPWSCFTKLEKEVAIVKAAAELIKHVALIDLMALALLVALVKAV